VLYLLHQLLQLLLDCLQGPRRHASICVVALLT
jgi:hypothetical protein